MSGEFVFDVTEEGFEAQVLERSKEVPVVVDFWAPWCGPCQVLGPMLKKLAEEYAGGFVLAKVDTDQCPTLAQIFQIQSIPAVHLVKDGKVADAFVGALPESEIRAFLEKHGVAPGAPGAPQDRIQQAEALLAAGREADAEAMLLRELEEDAGSSRAHLLLGRIAIARGDEAAGLEHLDRIPEDQEAVWKEAERLRGAAAFREGCGEGVPAWRARLEADEGDIEARYGLGCCLAFDGRYEDALEALLEVVKRDKAWRDGAARKAMVSIFGLLGHGHELASRYRKQLVIYL